MLGEELKKNNKDFNQIAIENNICGVCRVMGYPPPCKGHGGTGGGGHGNRTGNVEFKECRDIVAAAPSHINTKLIPTIDSIQHDWKQLLKLRAGEVAFELGLLSIESDILRGLLTFRKKSLLSEEEMKLLKDFLNIIKLEFISFKNKLNEDGISTKNFALLLKDDSLTIRIPDPRYYDAFILQLTNKNLLPSPKTAQKNEVEMNAVEAKKNSNLSPFDIHKGPRPKAWKDENQC